jgi:hypothetical protein
MADATQLILPHLCPFVENLCSFVDLTLKPPSPIFPYLRSAKPRLYRMWKIFKKDKYAKIDRRKIRAEKEHMRARSRAKRRKRRADRWRSFRRSWNKFIAHPFPEWKWKGFKNDPLAKTDRQKQRIEKQYLRARQKAKRRHKRTEAWGRFRKHFVRFFANPFAKRQLTAEERERRRIRKIKQHDRRVAVKKWWTKFKKNPFRVIFPSKKRRSADGGYLYVYNMSKKERQELARIKRKQNLENFKKAITTPELRRKFMFAYLHSTAYFIFAFMFIYIFYQVVTIMVASSYHIPVVWYYYELKFPLYTYSPLYTRAAMVTIFAAGPILSLMLAFVFLKLFFTKKPLIKRFQLLWLWGFICGANMFFGAYIAGFFTRTEFIYTSEWLFMSNVFDIEEIIFTIISLVMMLIIGRIVTPLFLLSSGSVTLVKPEFRMFFVVSQVILPWLSGTVVLFLITLPTYYIPLIIKTITPVLVLLPSLYLYDSLQYENIHKSGVIHHNYFRWSIVIAAIALLFFYRVILAWGLKV